MANWRGHHTHGTQGGRYKRKNYLSISFNGFAEYAEQLERLGANVEEIFIDVMKNAAKEIAEDTHAALAKTNLPARGLYSRGDTDASVIDHPYVERMGSLLEVPLGFRKTVPGAGGFLITGTPKMPPDYELEKIYGKKDYERKMMRKIEARLQDEIDDRLG